MRQIGALAAKLDAATWLEEVEAIERQDEALRVVAHHARLHFRIQNTAAAERLRAQRKGGEMLARMEKAPGGQPYQSQGATSSPPPPRLTDLGLDKHRSRRWQQVAAVPSKEFEAYVEQQTESEEEVTQAGLLRAATRSAHTKRRPSKAVLPPLPTGTYDLLLADPPWRYDMAKTANRAVENHYPTMSVEQIAELKVPSAPDAVLFLWATAPKLREALAVVAGWQFEYVTNAVWVKDRIGIGYYFRGQHELLLVGKRGNAGPPAESARASSVITASRRGHSQKPASVYELLESMYPEARRVELFARGGREGWASWGDEALK